MKQLASEGEILLFFSNLFVNSEWRAEKPGIRKLETYEQTKNHNQWFTQQVRSTNSYCSKASTIQKAEKKPNEF